ncbi:hypothetical protein Gotur_020794 [Gossypium turneri]
MKVREMVWWWWIYIAVAVQASIKGEDYVTYDGRSLIINGQRKLLFSGSIHYPRSTPQGLVSQLWRFLIVVQHTDLPSSHAGTTSRTLEDQLYMRIEKTSHTLSDNAQWYFHDLS